MTGTYSANQLTGGGTAHGWQNFDASAQYLAVVNPAHEFLMSFGVDHNFGGSGATGVGASRQGATTQKGTPLRRASRTCQLPIKRSNAR